MAKYIPLETVEGIKDFLQRSDEITNINKSWTKKMEEYRKGQYSILDWLFDDLDETMVEIESRPKGKWLIDDNYKIELYGEYCSCPHCKEWTINGRGMDKLNYCPNCGADMRGNTE